MKIFNLRLTGTTKDKSKVKISQNFVAFSEYMNFNAVSLISSQFFFDKAKDIYAGVCVLPKEMENGKERW